MQLHLYFHHVICAILFQIMSQWRQRVPVLAVPGPEEGWCVWQSLARGGHSATTTTIATGHWQRHNKEPQTLNQPGDNYTIIAILRIFPGARGQALYPVPGPCASIYVHGQCWCEAQIRRMEADCRNFSCENCSKRYLRKNNLEDHVLMEHPDSEQVTSKLQNKNY